MRWIAALWLVVGLATGAGADGVPSNLTAKDIAPLIDAEKRTLASMAPRRLNAMVATPRAKDLDYSRSWVAAQPSASGGEDWRCLAEALYFEARGESVKGQFAVAEVIMNRVDEPRFPSNVCAVIQQGTGARYQCQFTYTCDGRKEVIRDQTAWDRVGKVARAVLDGAPRVLTNGATHYHTRAVRPRWSRTYNRTVTIGYHVFYRHTGIAARSG